MSVTSRALLVRPFVAADWIGAIMACPHCGKLLKIVSADGPQVGLDPSHGFRVDRYWIVTFEDGTDARMWEDRKGVVLNRVES